MPFNAQFCETLLNTRNMANPGAERYVELFYKECTLLSELRHPHIVLFVGICFLPASRIPMLVMEKMRVDLENFLEDTPNIPISTKLSILHDVASGLVYLHYTITPGVIHGNLVAKNVLLNEAMTAKIADMGECQRVNQELTIGPGNILCMPPEGFTDRYSTPLDMFSFGHLSLFVGIQEHPADLLEKTSERQITRTEVVRRTAYIQKLVSNLGKDHSLVRLIQQCLQNEPAKRPTANEALRRLGDMKTSPHQLR